MSRSNDYQRTLLAFRLKYWRRKLRQAGGDVPEAARLAGIRRTDAYKVLKRLGIPLKPRGRYGHIGNWGASLEDRPRPFNSEMST